MKKLGIILARGGSKRLPRKNILDFFGKPMLAWTIEAAISSGVFDRVLVSTDDKEIAEIAIKYGAEAPFLRGSAADDITPSSEATLIALEEAEKYWQEKYEIVAQLMANCPLRTADDISHLMSRFLKNEARSQISCFRFGWMNPWWAFKLSRDGSPSYLFDQERKSRSQDLQSLYCATGALWIANSDSLRNHKTFYAPDHRFEEISLSSAVDIDDAEDFEMAKIFYLQRWQ